VLNGSLEIVELICMGGFEEPRVTCGEVQCKLEILPLLLLWQAKPTHDRDTLEREVVGSDCIDIRVSSSSKSLGELRIGILLVSTSFVVCCAKNEGQVVFRRAESTVLAFLDHKRVECELLQEPHRAFASVGLRAKDRTIQ
jgi:hypothetical protein